MKFNFKKNIKSIFSALIIFVLFLSGFPNTDFFDFFQRLTNTPVEKVEAATFQMQTGYYVGDGASQAITGLGFTPELVILKSDSNATATFFKTNLMANNAISYMGSATADSTAGFLELNSDGFTVSSSASTVSVRYTWIAFAGSDCSASGTMCLGAYTGDGAATQAITSVGFQPDLVWTKRTTNERAGTWRSSSMSTNHGQYFSATTADTTGALFTTLDSTGFTVGLSNNTNAGIYYYVAFKEVSGYMDVGTYTGNATDNTNITGVGFQPDWVFLKNADAGTPVSAVHNSIESYGDSTKYFTNTTNVVDSIQALESDGFQVGTHSTANGSGNTIYYAAFKGAAAHSSSGSFQMASGSYTGTGAYQTINGLEFEPDLVIIKGETTQYSVFRTSLMGGDLSGYLGNASTHLSGAITSINSDGFNVGTSATVNTSGTTYHWQAFGGAWSPETNSGASDFFVGAYYGNGINDRDITRLPFQPDFVVTKRTGSSDAALRTSSHTGDSTSFFAATADIADSIQAFNSDGFEIGTHASANQVSTVYYYFGFKEGADFDVGTYTGDGVDDRDITAPGFDPNLVWIKRSTAVAGVLHPTTLAGDLTQYFTTTAQAAGRIKSFVTNGFRLGTQTEVNANGGTYYYVAWDNNSSQGSPSAATYKVQTGYYIGNGSELSVTGLGFKPELVILKSDSNIGVIFKTTNMPSEGTGYLGQALADVATGLITLDSDGFHVTSSGNSVETRYTWTAFAGSDCSASGKFCIGAYTGDGAATQAITSVGFQPDLVIVKRTSNERAGTWRSSSMSTNHGQYFSATTADTTGALFTTLDSTGFTVGLSNNTNAGIYYYLAFKETSGSIDVGTYTGNATDDRSITGVGFSPEWVFLKNADAGTPVSAVHSLPESYGDSTKYFTNTTNVVDSIQALESDGFQVGTHSTANGSGNTIYYAAFNGTETNSTGSGNFVMDKGSYTGNGVHRRISGLAFEPDLVIIKGETTQSGSFRTRSMWGNSSSFIDLGSGNVTNNITALNSDGFNVGSGANVNTSGVTYHWQAFGGAWQPETNSGSTDFFIGAHYGNSIGNRDISRLPFQPDLVVVKREAGIGGVFRTSAHTGDSSSAFAANADSAGLIQAFNSDGFELGTASAVNLSTASYWYFGFKEGTKFDVGTYTGDGVDDRDITAPNFDPDLLWIKRSTNVAGVTRPSTLAGDLTQYFIATAQAAGIIKSFIAGGFRLGTATEVNASGGTYYFSAWSETGVMSPTFEQAAYRFFENDDSTDVGAVSAAQDTAADLANTGDAFRLRALLAVGASNLSISGQDFKLQYVDKGAGTCAAPSGGTPATYTDVTAGTLIAYNDNATPADADALTANANDPTDGGATIVNQSYQELNNFTNDEAAINNGEDGKWDFALVDNGADPETTFCFKIVTSAGDDLDTYTVYPEITTAPTSQTLTFSISDSSVGFGNLSASSARYATGDTSGSGSDSADAHTISVATNASGGYVLSINGNTLTCASCGGATIDAIGGSATASSVGTNQFGLRLAVNSGTGLSTAPYASADWAFDTGSLPDQVASGAGDGVTTEFGVRYIANIESVADAGDYTSTLTYTATATY